MARVSTRSFLFFRLSPAEEQQHKCYLLRQGEIRKRIDAYSNQSKFKQLINKIYSVSYPVQIIQNIASDIFSGSTPVAKGNAYIEPPNGVRFLRSGEITEDGEVTSMGEVHITEEVHNGLLRRSQLNSGDVLIAIVGATIGSVGVYERNKPSNINQAIAVVRLRDKEILPKYLCYYLKSNIGQGLLDFFKRPVARANINLEEISEIPVLIPPREIQLSLVAAMDEERSHRKQKLAESDALLSSLDQFILDTLNFRLPPSDDRKVYATTLSQMIGDRIDPYSNKPYFQKLFNAIQNSQHNVLTLSELSIRIFSGTTPLAKGDAYVEPPNGVRFIRSGEITTEGTVTLTSEVHISDEIHTGKMKSSQLQKGDLLIAIVGATIGSVGIYNLDQSANINQAIASVRLDNKEVLGEYICWYLKSSIGQRLLDYFKRPVARANINLTEVGEIPIIIPNLQTQETIITEVYNRRSEAQRLRSEAETGWQIAKQWFEDQLLGGS
ncbi:MAG: restriction endonuclease subunit S [Pseudanabaena sp. M179S2SP2A07QC]|nr:restriction endonuclease subunit S [Pseudanabaena sp. M179S2SP2A07QC]